MSNVPSHLKRIIALPIFRGLSEFDALGILELAEEARLPAGRELFKEGAVGDSLYLLITGQMEILKSDRNGEQLALARITDGGVLGEMSLLSDTMLRSASARAVTDSTLLRLPASQFAALVAQNSVPALQIIRNLAHVLSRRLALMDEKLVNLIDKGRKREELAEFQRILTDWSF